MIVQVSGNKKVAGYVLAGGASSRFGRDKALARLAGETLLQRMLRLLSAVADSVHIVATADRYPENRESIVSDLWPGEGALGAILTALHASRKSGFTWNVIVSCDMPFLTSDWLQYMLECGYSCDAAAVFPRSRSGDEPLCSCWRTSALPTLEASFEHGVRKVTNVQNLVSTKILDETHWKRFDTIGQLFRNVNTPQDYESAVKFLAAK